MLQKYLPVFLIFLIGVLGCRSTETIESTKVSATEIYQDYTIRGSKSNTSVTATFRVSGQTGSTVDLDAPAKIDHNGKEMSESKPGLLKGTDYQDSANEFVSNHKFKFTDADGKVWENEIGLDALEITAKDISISKTNGGTITLSRSVGKNENVEFSITSEKTPPSTNTNANSNSSTPNYSTNLQFSFDASRTSIKVEPSSLKNFIDGKANILMTVRKNNDAQQSAKGGSMNIIYEAQKVSANIVN